MTLISRREALALAAAAGLIAATGLPALAQEAATPATEPVTVPELVLGNKDAKVTLTEYASYTCPHCASFHSAVFKQFKTDYVDTGKVKFVMREVYFDRYGFWASIMARCGGDMRYFGISSILFDKQREWAASDDPTQVLENIKTIGRSAGLGNEQLEACFQDQAFAEAMIADFQKNMAADDVQGTPTLFITGPDGKKAKHSNMSYDDLRKLLDAELAKS